MKRVATLSAVVLVAAVASWARAAPSSTDALRAAVDSDELSLAALVARLGDDRVLEALSAGQDPLLQLAALRATPYLRDKDLALLPLVQLAAGRDPELAPPAAWRLPRIAQTLVEEGLENREVLPASLVQARAAMNALAADMSARSDVRACAARAAHLLGTLGVSAASPPTVAGR